MAGETYGNSQDGNGRPCTMHNCPTVRNYCIIHNGYCTLHTAQPLRNCGLPPACARGFVQGLNLSEFQYLNYLFLKTQNSNSYELLSLHCLF